MYTSMRGYQRANGSAHTNARRPRTCVIYVNYVNMRVSSVARMYAVRVKDQDTCKQSHDAGLINMTTPFIMHRKKTHKDRFVRIVYTITIATQCRQQKGTLIMSVLHYAFGHIAEMGLPLPPSHIQSDPPRSFNRSPHPHVACILVLDSR